MKHYPKIVKNLFWAHLVKLHTQRLRAVRFAARSARSCKGWATRKELADG